MVVTSGFNFYPSNHSVARAEFRYPCIPYETVEIGRRGFFSDLVPVQAILNDPPHFDVKINDTEPIFFYWYDDGTTHTLFCVRLFLTHTL